MSALTVERATELSRREAAIAYLTSGGWMVTVIPQAHGDDVWELFFAYHKQYHDQRALDYVELVRRCEWDERNRIPKAT